MNHYRHADPRPCDKKLDRLDELDRHRVPPAWMYEMRDKYLREHELCVSDLERSTRYPKIVRAREELAFMLYEESCRLGMGSLTDVCCVVRYSTHTSVIAAIRRRVDRAQGEQR